MNPHVVERITAIQQMLIAGHAGGSSLSSATKGAERSLFVSQVLSNVIAPPFRVGSGDITEHLGARSGQLDTVIEYAMSISLPLGGPLTPRLYLAEAVCCVVEVKSDLAGQWDEVLKTAKQVTPLIGRYGTVIQFGASGTGTKRKIPVFAVGFKGWKTEATAQQHLDQAQPHVDAALVIDPGVFVANSAYTFPKHQGPLAIYDFLMAVEQHTSSMIAAKPSLGGYVK